MFARQTVARTAARSAGLLAPRLPAAQATRKYVLELRPSTSPSSAAAAYTISTPSQSSTAASEPAPPTKAPLQAYPLRRPTPAPIPKKQPAAQKPIAVANLPERPNSADATTPAASATAPSATTTAATTTTTTETETANTRTQQKQATEPTPAQADKEKTAQPQKPRRPLRPLRARKAAITLSPAAIKKLRDLLDLPSPKLIKVGVKQKGCSGLTYDLEYVDKPGMLDEVVEQDGVKVVVDSRALMSVIGSEMHWEEDILSQKFVFRNPNIKQACGCGESFMV